MGGLQQYTGSHLAEPRRWHPGEASLRGGVCLHLLQHHPRRVVLLHPKGVFLHHVWQGSLL